MSQNLVPLLHKSVFQYNWTWWANHFNKGGVFQYEFTIFILVALHSFHWNNRFVYFRTKGAYRCLSIFSSHTFFVFHSTNCSNSFLFLWISRKINPLNATTFSCVKAWACSILRFTGLSVVEIAKKLEKSECWVVEWSWRNEGFKGKKLRGKPKALNKAAKIVLKKASYKIGDLTGKLSLS